MRSTEPLEILLQSTVLKNGSLIGTPSTITSVLMVVLDPKPRMLNGCPVGWSWPVGTVKDQTPGIRLMIWSTPVSGAAWICSRVITVVLTSSFSRSDPRPAVTVTGGRLTGGESPAQFAPSPAPVSAQGPRLRQASPRERTA